MITRRQLCQSALLGLVPRFAFAQRYPQEPIPARRIADEIRAQTAGLNVWWTGHNGWLIKHGDVLIGTDLVVDQNDRLYSSPISAAELAPELDVSFVTHGHGDHFNRPTSRVLAENSKCTFVIPRSCEQIARDIGIPKNRIQVARPGEPFEISGVKVQPVRALHGNPRFAVHKNANLDDCGYHLTIGGKTFLQPGDSVLLEDHLFLKHVDVLFFSPTEHNMHVDSSVILINELEPDYIVPQHRDTYRVTPQNRYWTNGYAYEVKLRLSKALQARYHVLEQGEKLEIR